MAQNFEFFFHPEIQLANKIFRFQPYSDIGQFIKAKQFGMPLFEFKGSRVSKKIMNKQCCSYTPEQNSVRNSRYMKNYSTVFDGEIT